ncbi:MAG TPA: YciI family protein [Rudaea sp.]|jgi:hypothetical protein|nr:YciI family protein [Rudaea sp.]
MQYAFLCYHREKEVFAWSKEQEARVMDDLAAVEAKLRTQGRLGPAVRLMPTSTATTLHKDRDPPLVVDGPFAETKEQLLGFFIIECQDQAHAIETARELAVANPGGSYEFRPVLLYRAN